MPSVKDTYWQPTFETLYDAWYHELASRALLIRWEKADFWVTLLAAVTASGSAVAGWALWTQPGWKTVWVVLAAVVGVLVIIHGALRVTTRVKEQGELQSLFSGLRIDTETFRHQLNTGVQIDEAKKTFSDLRKKLSEYINRSHPDIAFTKGLQKNVQEKLDTELRQRKIID